MAIDISQDGTRAESAGAGQRTGKIGADEMFCQSCGRVIPREASICVGCGVATRRAPVAARAGSAEPKSKTTSVLLAIFFSFFTWLYTYREDSVKFRTACGVSIVNVVLTFFTFGLWVFIAFPVAVGFWIWAVVDVVVKSDDWYASY